MGRRRAPDYWWDFYWEDDKITAIHVESDADYLPAPVKVFAVVADGPCDRLIEDTVMPFIADLKAGRADPRRC